MRTIAALLFLVSSLALAQDTPVSARDRAKRQLVVRAAAQKIVDALKTKPPLVGWMVDCQGTGVRPPCRAFPSATTSRPGRSAGIPWNSHPTNPRMRSPAFIPVDLNIQ